MAKNWLATLTKYEDTVTGDYNPHEHVLRTSSPSVNFLFGKGHGLPMGLTLALGGPPKGGKTLLTNMFVGQIHKDYPDGLVVKFDTEFRAEAQMTPEEGQRVWGIDPDRFVVYQTNNPEDIFDRIEREFSSSCQEGMPLKCIIIDSVTGIKGRRAMNADSIATQQIGDEAKTLSDGFKRILDVVRKYKIALILICQIRAEMDPREQMRGNKVKMSLPFALQHLAEYFMFIEENKNKDAKQSLDGAAFINSEYGDMDENSKGERTGHKIRAKMKDSSCGPKGRTAEFTLDYQKGLVNQWEEIFRLGVNRGVITRPNLQTYVFGDKKWRGKEEAWKAVREDEKIQKAILDELFRRDTAGEFSSVESEAEDDE
jgi:RecA/RadA recombinase